MVQRSTFAGRQTLNLELQFTGTYPSLSDSASLSPCQLLVGRVAQDLDPQTFFVFNQLAKIPFKFGDCKS